MGDVVLFRRSSRSVNSAIPLSDLDSMCHVGFLQLPRLSRFFLYHSAPFSQALPTTTQPTTHPPYYSTYFVLLPLLPRSSARPPFRSQPICYNVLEFVSPYQLVDERHPRPETINSLFPFSILSSMLRFTNNIISIEIDYSFVIDTGIMAYILYSTSTMEYIGDRYYPSVRFSKEKDIHVGGYSPGDIVTRFE